MELLTIPTPTIPFSEVIEGLRTGKKYWTIRRAPHIHPHWVDLYYAEMTEEEEYEGVVYPPEPGFSTHGGYWKPGESSGDEGHELLDEAVEKWGVDKLLWYEARTEPRDFVLTSELPYMLGWDKKTTTDRWEKEVKPDGRFYTAADLPAIPDTTNPDV